MRIDFQAVRPQLIELCRKYGIAELSVFGSVARGRARPDSDIDLLYVLAEGNDIGLEFFNFQEELEKLLGHKVDVVSKEGLHWIIRDHVLNDAQVLYAA
ncbi:nucleotidyltransferase family protein [Sphaerimonospora thailandensis]|uniref:Nucleotidyltransferase n=1 Tax=Sphaerimonospora thailandensis TaxID=795644 RepID=A0A8J3VXT5_9ACTN|nr:nucleotidyltransferase family protein [Sphaerimonospora thailandensis]GIH69259.1 nucleotidyltransferase [Sphaerimonospora thailandensis]